MAEENSAPYAGRWVAVLRGKVVAHGGTPEQALIAAKKSRPKESPEITYVSASHPLPPLLDSISRAVPDQELYLVGGAVRDMLLGRVSHDLDLAVPRGAIGLARRVAAALQADFFVLDEAFDTARVIVPAVDPAGGRDVLDFAGFRGPNLEADLRGRDFTINAIAFDLAERAILDPLNGAGDLLLKTIRACSPAAFTDDPVRILRAVRQAAALEFRIEPGSRKAMKAAAGLLPGVSPERQRDELFKILEGRKPEAALRALDLLGALPELLPELADMKGVRQSGPHIYDVWEHTLAVLGYLGGILNALGPAGESAAGADLFTGLLAMRLGRYREKFAAHFAGPPSQERSLRGLLFFAALYHDAAKPATRSVEAGGRIRFFDHDQLGAERAARRGLALRLSNAEVERVETIVRQHMRFHFHSNRMEAESAGPSRKAIYRFFRDTGEAGVDLILLGLADLRGARGPGLSQEAWTAALDIARIFLENYWERPQETVAPPPLVDGHDVIREYNLEQGPWVGRVLEAIREAQATGSVSTREQALAFGRSWLEESRK
jgi:tRNA nucleotidyltransferase/poly(A) polymerase